ncbi:MAG: translocation/assembly module TamB domain-containing protein [Vulcanimicrobiaceae bacterium]|jgi:hypothetical protein
MRNRWRKAAIGVAAIVLLATTGWFARFALLRAALEGGVALATGYHLRIGDLHAGGGHLTLHDVHLSRRGDRVLDVDVIDVGYVFRDFFPGGKRRYGLTGVALQRPRLYVIRRTDGAFNISIPKSETQPGGPALPLIMLARATNGSIDLIDNNNLDPSAHHLQVQNIDFWARVDTGALTRYRLDGALAVEGHVYPVHAQATIDVDRGYAMQRVRAADIPIRGLGNFLINSDVALLQRGNLRDLDLRVYALDVKPNVPFTYHLAGGARLTGIGVKLAVLTQTVEALHGPLVFDDDTIVSPKMSGRIGATPLVLAGGMFDFSEPKFRLAVLTHEDLRILHRDFNFLRTEPLAGQLAATCMLEGAVSDPLILADATGKELFYKAIRIRNFRATIAYHRGMVFAGNVRAQVGGVHTRVAGRFLVGGKQVDSELALAADAPAGRMPYLDRIAPNARTHITITGAGQDLLLDTHAVLNAVGPGENVSGTFALNPQGVGELGAFHARQEQGGVDGAFVMDRERGSSALWLNAAGLRIYPANPAAALEGVELPSFPPITGLFNGQVAGVDINQRVILLGKGLAMHANFQGVPIARASAEFGGPIDRLALGGVDAYGEFGHFVGRGALRSPGFAFAGNLDGTLEGMRRWTGDLGASGGVHGAVAVLSDGANTLVQTPGVGLVNGRIHGVPIRRIEGTFAVKPFGIVVYAAAADIAGGRAVARGNSRDGIALATAGIDARNLRATGLPVSRGLIIGTGDLKLTGPHQNALSFDGSIALDDGRVLGRRIDGSANIAYSGDSLGINSGSVALSNALTFVDGRINDLGSLPHYDVHANLGYANLGSLAHEFRFPVPYLQGFAAGDVQMRGSGNSPTVSGALQIPIGSVNGLAFEDMHALVDVAGDAIKANGRVTVGSTRAKFNVFSGKGLGARIDSDQADLSDFNDYFPRAGTFSGRGSVHAHFTRNKDSVASDGSVDLRDFRYLAFPFGDTKASWNGVNGNIAGSVHIAGVGGSLDGSGTISVPKGTKLAKIASATSVDVRGAVRDIDLDVWLPAAGYTPPVFGHVNASGAIRGRYPALALDLDGEMDDARIGRLPIDRVRISAAAQAGPGQAMRTQIRSADISIAGIDLHGSGSLGFRPQDTLALDLDAHAAHLGDMVQRLTGKAYDLDGVGDVHIAVRGTPSSPTAQAAFSISPLRVSRLQIPSISGTAVIDRERIALRDTAMNLPSGKVSLSGGVPLIAGPKGIPPTLPLSFDLALDDIGMDQFAVLGPPHTKLDGVLGGDVHVRGTVGAPQLGGSIQLTGGGYTGPLETRPIKGIDAALAFNETSATLTRFTASIGGGTLDGSGSLALPTPSSGTPLHYSATFTADAIRMAFPGYGSFRADGSLALESGADQPGTLTGDVRISDASVPLNDFLRAGAAGPTSGRFTLATPAQPAPTRSLVMAALPIPEWVGDLGLNLRLEAGNNVRIRSPILDIGGKGSVQIAGRLRDPTLAGELNATPGGSLFLNRAFKLQEASVRFSPTNGIAPALYARATTEIQPVGGYQPIDVTVTAQGLIPDIKLSYASNPPYDEGTIVGLLFNATALGAPVGTLNAFAPTTNILLPPNAFEQTPGGTFALSQEASSLINAQFTARLLAPIEQGLGSAFGLSDLSINVAPTGSVGVQARRLLGNNISALYGASVNYPYRMTFGLESRPTPETSVVFTAFTQQGLYSFGEVRPDSYLSANPLLGSAADAGGTYGFTVNIQRRSH